MVLIFEAISMVMLRESDLIKMNFKLSRNDDTNKGTAYFDIYHSAPVF